MPSRREFLKYAVAPGFTEVTLNRWIALAQESVEEPNSVTFSPVIPRSGRYHVCIAYRPSKARPTNVPVTIKHAGGEEKLTIDQTAAASPFPFALVGEYRFNAGDKNASIELSDACVEKGRVAIDGVRWIWLGE